MLADVETPGKLRKVGPSLRHVASKLDFEFLYSWIRQPERFPSLDQDAAILRTLVGPWSRRVEQSQKFEPIEIRGIAEYLLTGSQPFEYIEAGEGRGGRLGRTRQAGVRGSLPGLPQARGVPRRHHDARSRPVEARRQAGSQGEWQRAEVALHLAANPSAYHPRTLMPNMILDPIDGRRRQD